MRAAHEKPVVPRAPRLVLVRSRAPRRSTEPPVVRRRSSRRWWAGFALTVVLAGVTALVALREAGVPVVSPRICAIAQVTRGPISGTLEAEGRLSPWATVRIGSELPGKVVAVKARPGERVKKGQVLARLDDATERAAVLAADAGVTSAGLLALRSERELDQILRSLRDDGLAPLFDPELLLEGQAGDVQLEWMHAATQLGKQEATLALAQALAARRVVRSPIDGVISSRTVAAGEQVAASPPGPPLFVIESDPAELRLEVELDERYAGRLRPGPATFTVPAHGQYAFSATIRGLDPSAEAMMSPRRYRVALDVENRDGALRTGMSATARLPLEGVADATLVPAGAVRDGTVWLAAREGRGRQIPIAIGAMNDAVFEAAGPGLVAGGYVITDPEPAGCFTSIAGR